MNAAMSAVSCVMGVISLTPARSSLRTVENKSESWASILLDSYTLLRKKLSLASVNFA